MKGRTIKRLAVLGAVGYAGALARLKPRPEDLIDLEWQREAPRPAAEVEEECAYKLASARSGVAYRFGSGRLTSRRRLR